MDYTTFNDNELISLAQEENEEAINILHKKYQPLITKKTSKYYKYVQNKGIEFDDLFQECMIGFEEAIKKYDLTNDTKFYTFSNICMDRQLLSEIRKLNRDKYKVLNESIPLETIENEEDTDLINFIEDNTKNPELGLLDEFEYQQLYEKIVTKLTDFEECVFNLKLQDFSYKEIADVLDKDPKSIDNAVQRIKNKIKAVKNA